MARGICVIGLLVLWLGISPAQAHAVLVASEPVAGGTVAAGQVSVRLRYNSRIDSYRSRISVTRPDGTSVVLPIAPSSAEGELETVVRLAPGGHVLHWQVLAVDGHITRGDVPFTVGGP
jgi:methionine-rich copper-binding protein CopC